MREIKFRCFFYDGKDYSTGQMISLNDGIGENYIEWNENELKPTDECTVLMQYTGLKDRNGKEIYEGDIVEHDNGNKYTVEWVEQICGFYLCGIGTQRGKEFILCAASKVENDPMLLFKDEIIGNVYENPTIIKQPN